MSSAALHLVTVWNPLYTSDVDQHFTLLLDWARREREGKATEDDVYVWWGKVRSSNRQQPMSRKADVQQLARDLEADPDREAHLYVTDYRSLYVGELLGIEEGDLPSAEQGHVPAYYRTRSLSCDFWFMLGDMRRLVTDDLPEVARELTRLHNVHYHDKPVSLYGGMVDLPLLVTRPDGARFFDADDRDVSTGGRLWVEHDLETGGGVSAIQADLRDNVLGESVWNALEPTVRTFVASAEKLFRDHRGDPAFDFGPVIGNFAKAMEVQCNTVLRRAAERLPKPQRHVNVEGNSVDLATTQRLSLGQLAHILGGDRELNQASSKVLENGAWFTGSLPAILSSFAEVRNAAVHSQRIDRDTAAQWRSQILGVGSKGHLADLAGVRVKRA